MPRRGCEVAVGPGGRPGVGGRHRRSPASRRRRGPATGYLRGVERPRGRGPHPGPPDWKRPWCARHPPRSPLRRPRGRERLAVHVRGARARGPRPSVRRLQPGPRRLRRAGRARPGGARGRRRASPRGPAHREPRRRPGRSPAARRPAGRAVSHNRDVVAILADGHVHWISEGVERLTGPPDFYVGSIALGVHPRTWDGGPRLGGTMAEPGSEALTVACASPTATADGGGARSVPPTSSRTPSSRASSSTSTTSPRRRRPPTRRASAPRSWRRSATRWSPATSPGTSPT